MKRWFLIASNKASLLWIRVCSWAYYLNRPLVARDRHIKQLLLVLEEFGICWECRKPFSECNVRRGVDNLIQRD